MTSALIHRTGPATRARATGKKAALTGTDARMHPAVPAYTFEIPMAKR
jgi:hypothetical protein